MKQKMRCPSIIDVRDVVKSAREASTGISVAGVQVWVPARAS